MPAQPPQHASSMQPARGLAGLGMLLWASAVFAWDWTIPPAPTELALQVGQFNSAPNTVSARVPAAEVFTGRAQDMRAPNASVVSALINEDLCQLDTVFIGAWLRTPSGASASAASLQATAPAGLRSGSDRIDMDQISWSLNWDPAQSGGDHIAAGRFINGGSVTLATVPANHFKFNCHAFRYANKVAVPPGRYTGTVVYTLTMQ